MGFRLNPIQCWLWRNPARRADRLLRFAEVEADGGRDLARAAEVTLDARLRRLYLRHAADEQRHSDIFRHRGAQLMRSALSAGDASASPDWLAPGERGLDDVAVEPGGDAPLLAFLHLSEAAAARAFATYRDAVGDDGETRAVFEQILRDETFHMNYTRHELGRVAPESQNRHLWKARLGRLWKLYLRVAVAIGNVFGTILLTVQYFILLPIFAWAAKRAARREPLGWREVDSGKRDLGGQY